MKLLALRVAAFRRFVAPAAVENFDDGVNVLSGPNEMGKSTLFHALEAAFLTRFKVSGAALDAMRPNGGGEPVVEVEFETQGRRWRIRKQFGRGAAAVLTDLASGNDARNSEAEERLAELTGRAGELPGGLGLVWVRQQRSLLPPDPDLDPETGREKARGERAALRDVIAQEIEAAATGDAFEAVRERARNALDMFLTPTRTAIKKGSALDAAHRLRDESIKKRDEARTAADAAEQRLARIAAMSQRIAEIENGATPEVAHTSLEDLETRRTAAADARTRRDLARETMRAREAEWNAARNAGAARQKLAEALDFKRTAQASAQKLSEQISVSVSEINADPATPAVIERLTTLDRQRAVAEAELAGQAAVVDVRIEEGGKGKLSIDGKALSEDSRLTVVEPLEIRIDGVAAITVSTPNAARGGELKAKSQSANREIEETLRGLGVASPAEARERAERRAVKVKDLERARTRLSELAPQGLQKLVDDVAGSEAELQAAIEQSPSDADAARLQSEASEARESFNALHAHALSDENFRALELEISRARQVKTARDAELKHLTNDLANAKGEQTGIDETGRAAEVAAREGEFERAEDEVRRLRHEAEALKLLETTLAEIEARAKTHYFAPVSRRLRPHVERVFGTSELSFKNDFAIDVFERAGVREDVAQLSDGTREQLSILVRVAFAEVLAESGRPVPLVLDDPLVYADDARLAAVCSELIAAKSVPQIVLLTCREKTFEMLPGRRLTVTNWRPERV